MTIAPKNPIPDQFTTTPNSYPSPLWEKPGTYWNPAYLKYIEKRDAKAKTAALEKPVLTTPDQWNGGYGKNAKTRICVVEACKKEFHPQGARQTTCSSACSKARKRQIEQDRYKQTYVPVKLAPRTCEVCSATYTSKYVTAKTCSPECSAELLRRNKRRWWREQKERRAAS